MATTTYSSEKIVEHKVFNELDSHGLTLGLPRLIGERNADYKQRLLNVFTKKANSTYLGLIHGITRELGLSLTKEFVITPTNSSLHPNASIFFKDVRCCIYPDYYNSPENVTEIDKYSLVLNGAYTLGELIAKIEAVQIDSNQIFTVTEESGIDLSKRAAVIFDQDSTKEEVRENISGHGRIISLRNKNLFDNSEYIFSRNLKTKVVGTPLAKGEYKINYLTGKIECYEAPMSGAYISYKYRNNEFEVFSSPVIINSLQSTEFRKKMFDQVLQEDGTYENGRPTIFGADIINELYSVYPTTYRK